MATMLKVYSSIHNGSNDNGDDGDDHDRVHNLLREGDDGDDDDGGGDGDVHNMLREGESSENTRNKTPAVGTLLDTRYDCQKSISLPRTFTSPQLYIKPNF